MRALPLNIIWGIWLARNLKLFEGHETLPPKCAIQFLNMGSAYPWVEEKKKTEYKRRCHPYIYYLGIL
jgi:hypothetical protein